MTETDAKQVASMQARKHKQERFVISGVNPAGYDVVVEPSKFSNVRVVWIANPDGTFVKPGDELRIDPEITATDIFRLWRDGRYEEAIDILEKDHPALTALVLVQGSHDRVLSASHCNSIVNLLIERRQKQVQAAEARA